MADQIFESYLETLQSVVRQLGELTDEATRRALTFDESERMGRLVRIYHLCKSGLESAQPAQLSPQYEPVAVVQPPSVQSSSRPPKLSKPPKRRAPIARKKAPAATMPSRTVSLRSEPVDVDLPVPVVEVDEEPKWRQSMLSDEMDRRARAYMSWAPWERRASRSSRRYEGFSRG